MHERLDTKEQAFGIFNAQNRPGNTLSEIKTTTVKEFEVSILLFGRTSVEITCDISNLTRRNDDINDISSFEIASCRVNLVGETPGLIYGPPSSRRRKWTHRSFFMHGETSFCNLQCIASSVSGHCRVLTEKKARKVSQYLW